MSKNRLLNRLLVAALVWGLSAAFVGYASAQAPADPRVESIRLIRLLRLPDAPTTEELAPELAEYVRAEPEILFEVLRSRRVEGVEPEDAVQALSIFQRDLCLAALARNPRPSVLTALDRWLASATPEKLSAGIEVVGAVGGSPDLRTVVKLASMSMVEEEIPKAVLEAVERAVASILVHDARGFDLLASLRNGAPAPLIPALVRAVGKTGDRAGAPFLADVLDWNEEHGLLALSQIRLVGAPEAEAEERRLLALVRPALSSDDVRYQQAAALALGALRDEGSLRALVGLLEAEHDGLVANANFALREITGLTFPAHAEQWDFWLTTEEGWYERESAAAFQKLASPIDGRVAEAMAEITCHRLHRDRLAYELSRVLEHRQPSLRRAACLSIGMLGSRAAAPALIAVVEHDRDERVREAALAALRTLGVEIEPSG